MNPKTFETWYKEKEVEFARNTLAGHFDRCDVVDAREYAAIQKDVARTVLFLSLYAPYITGQIIAVDGGRSI